MTTSRKLKELYGHDPRKRSTVTTFCCDECGEVGFQEGAQVWQLNYLSPELLVCEKCRKELIGGKESEAYEKMRSEITGQKRKPVFFSPPERKAIQLMVRLLKKELTKIDRKRLLLPAVREQVRKVHQKLKEAGKLERVLR